MPRASRSALWHLGWAERQLSNLPLGLLDEKCASLPLARPINALSYLYVLSASQAGSSSHLSQPPLNVYKASQPRGRKLGSTHLDTYFPASAGPGHAPFIPIGPWATNHGNGAPDWPTAPPTWRTPKPDITYLTIIAFKWVNLGEINGLAILWICDNGRFHLNTHLYFSWR